MNQRNIEFAYAFAERAHAGQKRKGGDRPYIEHPGSVARKLKDLYPEHEALVIAGLLHDVVEDTKVTIASIEAIFGPDVAALVWGVTKTRPAYALPVGEPWGPYDRDILRLKGADLFSNLTDTQHDIEAGHFIWGAFARGRGKMKVWADEVGHVGLLLKVQTDRKDRELVYPLRDLFEVVQGLSSIVTDEERDFLARLEAEKQATPA